jgi:hypothetical protein
MLSVKSQRMLRSLDHLTGLDALCAYLHPAIAPAGQLDPNGLQIRVKSTAGLVVRV